MNHELEELQAKKKRLEVSIKALREGADAYADDAEKTGNVALIAQSNAHRCSAKEKVEEVNTLEKQLALKEKELKSAHV